MGVKPETLQSDVDFYRKELARREREFDLLKNKYDQSIERILTSHRPGGSPKSGIVKQGVKDKEGSVVSDRSRASVGFGDQALSRVESRGEVKFRDGPSTPVSGGGGEFLTRFKTVFFSYRIIFRSFA